MPAYFAERALLPSGWARHVRIEVAGDGYVASIEPGAAPEGAERLAGPLLPGMPNLHSHAFQRAMAGLAEVAGNPNDSFWTWRDLMYRLVGQISPEQLQVIARQLYIEMLKAGYTAVAEFHYVHHDQAGKPYADPAELSRRISAAAADSGIGLTLLPVLYSHAGFGGLAPNHGQRRFINTTDQYLQLQAQLAPALATQPAQRLGLCFHSLRAVAPAQLAEVKAYIEPLRPVTAELYVLAPVHVKVIYSIHLTPDTSAARAAVEAQLRDLHSREAGLGDALLITHIAEAISSARGETDHVLVSPIADVPAGSNELLIFGGCIWLA